ncbi:MAG: hypothetical protein IH878_15450 [Gemmatimonadetes bacterium]|nr:hypothetical protein [Gemmatimonadota bacterium]
MASSKLIRWSGLVSMVGGLLVIASAAIELLGGSPPDVMEFVTFLLLLLALIGLYVRQARKAGALGAIGFLLAFIATALWASLFYADAFYGGPPQEVTAVFFAAYLSFPLGYLLFGIATMRAGMLPRWGALLLAVGAVLLNFLVPVSVVLAAIGFAMFGAAFLWLGYALWSGTGETERQPEPST